MSGHLRAGLIGAAIAVASTAAMAHGGGAHAPAGWSFDPLIAGLVASSLSLQLAGLARMGPARATIAPAWRVAAYATAIATVVVALFSPIDARADASFAWHMLQHLLLMLVAAPLLAVSNAHFVALHALPLRWRRVFGRSLGLVPGVRASTRDRRGPWLAALAFAGGLWLWHAPAMYQAALADRLVHTTEHLVFLFTAAIFWRMVSTAGDRRLDLASSILLVTLVGLQGNLMAALITLAPTPLYAGQGTLADQQLAGLIMWVPAGAIYLASTVFALRRLIAMPRPGPSRWGRRRTAPAAMHRGGGGR